MCLDEFCTDSLVGKEITFSCPLGLDSIEMLADFTASLGNHRSIQGLGSQMPALISIDKGKGGMSKCKTFPSSIELREAAWCGEEVESRTSGLYLLLALLPTCFVTLSKSVFCSATLLSARQRELSCFHMLLWAGAGTFLVTTTECCSCQAGMFICARQCCLGDRCPRGCKG